MVKLIVVFIGSLFVLVPVCLIVGYGIGGLIAAYVYPVTGTPDRYREDRELFAGVYGIMFIGGFLYVASALFVMFRLMKSIRKRRE
ncbi:hypothetical protein [Afipia felis]|uniref:Uncharacterized protein n=2 Tax=Afipia felis TaxID=1035 RepID=A0A380WCW5_AFIFE|nr:hypothetical protein [Afipia felis]EKS29183.1 hypothetical protein HMPREF9697_01711 [Afipia felis ATCC 53690]SUU77890.1 Uncharacterised protein [Afipia felis]SUU85955.1 Uncharacterised protein [Afipia felis]